VFPNASLAVTSTLDEAPALTAAGTASVSDAAERATTVWTGWVLTGAPATVV